MFLFYNRECIGENKVIALNPRRVFDGHTKTVPYRIRVLFLNDLSEYLYHGGLQYEEFRKYWKTDREKFYSQKILSLPVKKPIQFLCVFQA